MTAGFTHSILLGQDILLPNNLHQVILEPVQSSSFGPWPISSVLLSCSFFSVGYLLLYKELDRKVGMVYSVELDVISGGESLQLVVSFLFFVAVVVSSRQAVKKTNKKNRRHTYSG